jgi:ComF family protein
MATVLPRITGLARAALDLLFPQWCIGCGREGSIVCASCMSSLVAIVPPCCPRCGRPVDESGNCDNCTGTLRNIDGIRAPFLFQGLVRQAVHEFKYRNLRTLGTFLARQLAEYLAENPVPADVLMPVPLHPRRLKERGYNQSSLLARHLSRLTGLDVTENVLIRCKHTTALAKSASREARQENIKGSFTVAGEELRQKNIILIDDVSTTGSTLEACAEVLKIAGAERVWGLVVALEL